VEPEIDPHIPQHYSVASVAQKAVNTAALRKRLLLREGPRPVLSYVGRPRHAEGLHLIRQRCSTRSSANAQSCCSAPALSMAINEDFWH